MARLSSVFRSANVIRKERALTNDELMRCVPSVFSGEKHESRSDRYTYIPTITLLDNLRKEGFQPFFACQTRRAMPESASIRNICCVFAVKVKLRERKCRRLFS